MTTRGHGNGRTIAVMNNGVVEQVASPRDIYDGRLAVCRGLHRFAAHELPAFRDSLARVQAIRLGEREVAIPAAREALVESDLVSVSGRTYAFHRPRHGAGRVYGTEYLAPRRS